MENEQAIAEYFAEPGTQQRRYRYWIFTATLWRRGWSVSYKRVELARRQASVNGGAISASQGPWERTVVGEPWVLHQVLVAQERRRLGLLT